VENPRAQARNGCARSVRAEDLSGGRERKSGSFAAALKRDGDDLVSRLLERRPGVFGGGLGWMS